METIEEAKDLTYWKKNAEEDYLKVPISVLRYISELEKRSYSEEDLIQAFKDGMNNVNYDDFHVTTNQWFEQFKKK